MRIPCIVLLACAAGCYSRPLRESPEAASILRRRYVDGETVRYRMTASIRSRTTTTSYTALAGGTVNQDSTGSFAEVLRWSELVYNGAAVDLELPGRVVEQRLSLANETPSLPDFARLHPRLIGPAADLLTFYADVWLAMRQGALRKRGDRAVVKHGEPNSWADGTRVILGQDAIDFAFSLEDVDTRSGVVTLLASHTVPEVPKIAVPADWMRPRVADTPNNWVEIKHVNSSYVAGVGKETFQAHIRLNLRDGRILSAELENPVDLLERVCSDRKLVHCGDGIRYRILRQISLVAVP